MNTAAEKIRQVVESMTDRLMADTELPSEFVSTEAVIPFRLAAPIMQMALAAQLDAIIEEMEEWIDPEPQDSHSLGGNTILYAQIDMLKEARTSITNNHE